MEEKIVLEDLLETKKQINEMEPVEFKTLWDHRTHDYAHLDYEDRLKMMVMSIKILQAKADLLRTINSIKECRQHPEPEKALYYFFRSNLWRFLDNFSYVLLLDDVSDAVKLECIALVEEHHALIASDEQLKNSCVNRLHRLLTLVRILQNKMPAPAWKGRKHRPLYHHLDQQISHLLHLLEPADEFRHADSRHQVPLSFQALIERYSAFSVARISLEKSGVLSIIQLLQDYPVGMLKEHQGELQEALTALSRQDMRNWKGGWARNQCAYALVILLELLKMQKGLPVLLLKILNLCAYIQYPPHNVSIHQELQGLKGRVANVSQQKLRPIIENVLWRRPEYLAKIPNLYTACPWGYTPPPHPKLNLSHLRNVVKLSFDQLLSGGQLQNKHEARPASQLSKTVIEILGLLVNVEPSPHFLKLHARETLAIKHAREALTETAQAKTELRKLLEQQYETYTQHLKFLQDSIEYYEGILDKIRNAAEDRHHTSLTGQPRS